MQMKSAWVLRSAISGETYASQDARPNDWEFPVLIDDQECYWALETWPVRVRQDEDSK